MGTVARGRAGISRRQTGSREQQARWLCQYVDSLNYFYYLLSLPPGQARPKSQAHAAGAPGSQPTEWSPTPSER